MLGVRLFKLLENVPVPVPSAVLKFDIVGFAEVPQQTPRDVTLTPPSDVTIPPLEALVAVILLTTIEEPNIGTVKPCGGGFEFDEPDLLQLQQISIVIMLTKNNLIFITMF